MSNERSGPTADLLTVGFMTLIVLAAGTLNVAYILFPELAALTTDVLHRPQGKWAKEPLKLIATPTATAVIGTAISMNMPYGVVPILLAMFAGIGVVRGLKSAVSPAISAGVLPIVLGIQSWLYPICIFSTITVLTALLLVWRGTPYGSPLGKGQGGDDRAVEILESAPAGRWWLLALAVFVALIGIAAQWTDWRFLLFPPLIVMGYEMLGHPSTCPWAKPPYTFPLASTASALLGVEAVIWGGPTWLSAAVVLSLTLLILKTLRLRLPPALAIGLIPFVMSSPTPWYALSVAIGTIALTVWFLLYRQLCRYPLIGS